jgi:hypothetical protein
MPFSTADERRFRQVLLFFEEIAKAALQTRKVSRPAFPDDEHVPAHTFEGFHVPPVPLDVPPALLLPELPVGRGSNPSVSASVHVPEAAVNENHLVS